MEAFPQGLLAILTILTAKKKKTLLQHKVVCVFIKRKNLSTVCHKSPIVSCVFIPLSFSLFRSLAATAKRNLREIERCCTTKMRELFLRTTATQKRDMRLRQSTEIKKKKKICAEQDLPNSTKAKRAQKPWKHVCTNTRTPGGFGEKR